MRLSIIFPIFLSLSLKLYSQAYVDLVSVSWDEGFTNDYNNGTEQAHFYEWNADVTLPFVINETMAIITGFQHEQVNLIFNNKTADIQTYGTAVKIGISKTHSNIWSGTYILLPKISADEITLQTQNLQLGAFVLIKRNYSTYKNLRFGFYTNSELFGPFVVPLLGYYLKSERSEFSLLAPLAADYLYQVNNNFSFGASFKGIIKSYQLNSQTGYLTKANNELGLVAKIDYGILVWQIFGGTTIGRNFRIYQDSDQLGLAISALKLNDHRNQINHDYDDGLFMKTSLIFRIPTN